MLFFLTFRQEVAGYHREQLEQQYFLLIFGNQDTQFLDHRILFHLVIGGIVETLFPVAGYLKTELRVDGQRCLSIFTPDQGDKWIDRLPV